MESKTYQVTLTGTRPLLMHQDDVMWREKMDEWLRVPANKKASKAGDDRFPAWRWIGGVYHDEVSGLVGIPSDNLMTMLREGSAKVASGGKNGETFKRMSQSCLIVREMLWPVEGLRGTVRWEDITAVGEMESFADHCKAVEDLGFSLWAKPAKVGQSKHVRVRARFETWTASGTIDSLDNRLNLQTLQDILTVAGTYCGLMDWRPSSPRSPGRFGTFTAEVHHAR